MIKYGPTSTCLVERFMNCARSTKGFHIAKFAASGAEHAFHVDNAAILSLLLD